MDWAKVEMDTIQLGDERLNKRLISPLETLLYNHLNYQTQFFLYSPTVFPEPVLQYFSKAIDVPPEVRRA